MRDVLEDMFFGMLIYILVGISYVFIWFGKFIPKKESGARHQ